MTSTFEELRDFFADAITGSKTAYLGTQLEVFRMGGGNVGLGLLLGIWYALFRRVTKQDDVAGLHLRVHFACPCPTRIHVTLRSDSTEEPTTLADRFQWPPALDQAVRSFATPDLEAAMLDLAGKFNSVLLTDRYLSFGPLLGAPAESAEVVQALISKASGFFSQGARAAERPEAEDSAPIMQ